MKKQLVFLLSVVLVTSVLLCACGKSEEVKEVENQINLLSTNSTYQEINDVYEKYSALSDEDKEDLENANVLYKYCDGTGWFVLTEDMIEEIEKKIEEEEFLDDIGQTMWTYEILGNISDWQNVEIASHKKENKYTYRLSGKVEVADEYGYVSTKKMELDYFAEYDAENEKGYSINCMVRVYGL